MDRRLIAIWMLLFSLYFSGTRFSLDGYELEYVLSAMNVFHGNGPAMAPGFRDCPGIWPTDEGKTVYPRQNFLQTYLSVPFYALGAVLFGENPTLPEKSSYWKLPWGPVLTVSMLNAMLAAFLAILVGLISRELGLKPPGHYILSILFGITSMNWHYGTLGMEIVQTTVMMAAIWSAIRFRFSGKISWFIFSILMIAALPNCKKISIIFVIPIVIYQIWAICQKRTISSKTGTAMIIIGSLSGFIIMTAMMMMRFHSDPDLFPHLLHTYFSGGFKLIDLFFALTVSPGEGFFIFNPLTVFAVPAWLIFYKTNRPESFLFMGITCLLFITIRFIPYSLIDEEWGPRYLFALLPLTYIAGAAGLLKIRKGTIRKVFITILVISIAIQWLSSMFLGFKMLDIPLAMGISDYMLTVFTPSLSQIWLTGICFMSHIKWLMIGQSLVIEHREFASYTGRGGSYRILRQDLDSFDYPAGGIFTVRWVLSEKGVHGLSPRIALGIKLMTDFFILGFLGMIAFRARREFTAAAD